MGDVTKSTMQMSAAESQPAVPQPRPRWYRLTPDRFVIGLLIVECLLWLSERFRWPTWHKGYAVLTALAVVGVVFMGMLLWFVVALAFRWRFQFSIRSLLVLVMVVAIPCSWLAVERQREREHREAVAGIYKSGGYVAYSYGNGIELPRWLLKLFGEELFGDIQAVDFCGSRVTDEDLQYLERLDGFDMLIVANTHITDAGLEHLEGLTQLSWLNLDGTPITDAGLENLKGLTQLRFLNINDTNVTDSGVRKLYRALPTCQIIH